ncbi:MAG: hypothetical protein ACI3XA_10345 [Clostridia bacterium]
MASITEELLTELKNASDLQSFFKKHENDFIEKSLDVYLNEFLAAKGISISDIIKSSGAGEYAYKIFKGERKPSRDILISIAFGMGLSLQETQLMLRIAKFAVLDPRDKRDGVIIYALTHNMTVFEADDVLDENNFTTINS